VADKKKIREQVKPSGRLRPALILLGAILVLTVFVYMPSLQNGILYGWDDGLYLEDEHIRNFDGGSISHFFTEYYLGMHQPLAVLSLAIDKQVHADNSSGYHLTSLLFHLLNIILVFFFIYFLTKKQHPALIVSLLFAIHPMHVEAVGWIAARSTLLFSIFYLAALIFYLRYLEVMKWPRLAITFLWFVMACFSKSMAVTLPVVLLLLDYYKGRKITGKVIMEKLPFLLVSIIFGIVSIKAAGTYGHIENLSSSYNLPDRFFLLTYGISFYIYKILLPVNLSALYSYPLKTNGLLPVIYYLSPLVIIALAILMVYLKKFRRELIFGLLFFLASISLVLPFYWSRIFIVSERYTYMTCIGLYFLIALAVSGLFNRENHRLRKYRNYFATGLIIFAAFYIYQAVQRTKAWKDTEVLLTDVIEKPHGDATHSYGYFYRANYMDMTMEFDRALSDYNEAIRLNPGFILAYNNRGIVKGMDRDFEGAVMDFSKALELKPDYADAWYNRGLANFQLGLAEQACKDWIQADFLGSPSAIRFIRQHCGN